MTEAMPSIFRQPDVPALAGKRARAANGAGLRWTPGPDELRLPSCEDEPVPQNTRHAVAIEESFGSLRLHWRRRRDVFVGSDQFVPAAGGFLPTRHELAGDNQRLAGDKRRAEARVAELEALIEKMRRG